MESSAIEVAVALFSIFLVYSLLVTQLVELIANLRSSRAKFLRKGIESLIGSALCGQLFQHPLIKAISFTRDKAPSYLRRETFAKVLLDIVGKGFAPQGITFSGASTVANRVLSTALSSPPSEELRRMTANLEEHFDELMDRVSGAYRRHARLYSLLVSLALVVVMNVDALKMAQRMWTNPSLRQEAAKLAAKCAERKVPAGAPEGTSVSGCPELANLYALAPDFVPMWTMNEIRDLNKNKADWFLKLLGLLVTTLAISLGAPFWFDLLSRLSPGLRGTGRRPETESESKER